MATDKRGSRSDDDYSSAELGQANHVGNTERTPLMSEQRHSAPNEVSLKNPSTPKGNPNKIHSQAQKRIVTILTATASLLVVVVIVAFIQRVEAPPPPIAKMPKSVLIVARLGAVAAEEIHCSEVGVQVLRDGGNAVDAAIASCLCIGTVNSFSSGIGGGGFMTVRQPDGTVEFIDFRETAPGGSFPTMFKKDPSLAQHTGLAVAVPGEIRGLELAHKRYGKLSWKRLFEPSIKLAREGWAVGPELARRLKLDIVKSYIETDPIWSHVFAPNGKVLEEGEWIKREALADTLETISEKGADEFYSGKIAQKLVKFIQETGGIMNMTDMANYKPVMRQPIVGYYLGRKIYAPPAPTSGPAMIGILNILERYDIGRAKDRINLDAHYLAEAMKYGYALRTELGDPDFTDIQEKIEKMVSKDTAARIRANISDTRTFPVDYYNPHWAPVDNHGTTSLSTVDKDNMALLEPETGIILNNEMDDFSIPGYANAFGLQPSPYNYPEPGKRPLSSAVPCVIENDGHFELAVGGSGGSRILTSAVQTILNVYNHEMNVMDAIESPRIHHQLLPDILDIEDDYPSPSIDYLKSLGHNVTTFNRFMAKAEIQAVMRMPDGLIHAASDTRKQAVAAGYDLVK
ncbi:hypothetical protein BGX31_006239 [Mortierella sp. GBA43]|nr:hypothetical protein BGX31_006239 [Mortierella sp. GBA43]